MVVESPAQITVPSRGGSLATSPDVGQRAKLVFAAAEDARQRGDVAEYERLVARWRILTKGNGVS